MISVTIITVCYNAETTIEKTIRSVLEQTYKNIEYIIIDGNSKDNTLNIVNHFKDIYPSKKVIIISEDDKGIYDAMNKGVKLASGKWILFLNSGDFFYNNNVVNNIFSNYLDKGESLIYGKTIFLDSFTNKIEAIKYSNYNFMPACHQSIFTRSSELRNHPFDLTYKVTADFVFYYELYKRNPNYYKTEEIISIYDTNGVSRLQYYNVTYEHMKMYLLNYDLRFIKMLLRIVKIIIKKKCHL